MCTRIALSWANLAIFLLLAPSVIAQDVSTVRFKNGMRSKITVFVKPDELNVPIKLQLDIDQIYEYKVKHRGLHAIQVLPHDQPDSGNFIGDYDLHLLAKKLGGDPFVLRGRFDGGERIAVFVDVPHPFLNGVTLQYIAPTMVYGAGLAEVAESPKPTRTSAVIAAVVPPESRVSIGGRQTKSTGEMRFYVTPRLTPGYDYSYSMKVEWTKGDGHECVETVDVQVRAGETTRVFFKLPLTRTLELIPVFPFGK